jgi:hypothetical protein
MQGLEPKGSQKTRAEIRAKTNFNKCISMISPLTFHFFSIHQWLCSPLLGTGLFFSFVIFFYTDGRTPYTSDQPVARLRYLDTGQNKHRNSHRHPCLEWDSNLRSQCSSERRQFIPSTALPLWSASSYLRCAILSILNVSKTMVYMGKENIKIKSSRFLTDAFQVAGISRGNRISNNKDVLKRRSNWGNIHTYIYSNDEKNSLQKVVILFLRFVLFLIFFF